MRHLRTTSVLLVNLRLGRPNVAGAARVPDEASKGSVLAKLDLTEDSSMNLGPHRLHSHSKFLEPLLSVCGPMMLLLPPGWLTRGMHKHDDHVWGILPRCKCS